MYHFVALQNLTNNFEYYQYPAEKIFELLIWSTDISYSFYFLIYFMGCEFFCKREVYLLKHFLLKFPRCISAFDSSFCYAFIVYS